MSFHFLDDPALTSCHLLTAASLLDVYCNQRLTKSRTCHLGTNKVIIDVIPQGVDIADTVVLL